MPERSGHSRRPQGQWSGIQGIALAACLAGCAAPAANVERGREIFMARDGGHCILCHSVPGVAIAGDVGPSLAGVGRRLSPAEIRDRIADITRTKPGALMPAFNRTEALKRVAPGYMNRPILTAQQVEDVVAYLSTLQ
jgi:sulfur-oxidizing protein SoxX